MHHGGQRGLVAWPDAADARAHDSTPNRSGPRSCLAAILARDRLRMLMTRLPLAPVLARASLRSSLAIVFAGSWVDPLQCEQVTGEVVDVGSAEPADQVIARPCGV